MFRVQHLFIRINTLIINKKTHTNSHTKSGFCIETYFLHTFLFNRGGAGRGGYKDGICFVRAHAIDEFYTKIVMLRVQHLFIKVNTLIVSKNNAYKLA